MAYKAKLSVLGVPFTQSAPSGAVSVTVTPDVAIAVYSVPAPTISAGGSVFVTPDVVTATYSVPAPTVFIRIHVTVTPDVAIAVYSVPNPTVQANVTVVVPSTSFFTLYFSPYFTIKAGGIPNYNAKSAMPTVWMRKCGGIDYSNERKLYRKMLTEVYNKFGVCTTYYIVSYDTQYDKIWGEDNDRRFIRKFSFMSYYPLNTEEKMWTKFAIEGIDQFSMFSSKDHFRRASTYGNTLVQGNIGPGTYPSYIPKTGDVVQSGYNDYLYEITAVKEESMMSLLNKNYAWELIVRPYKDYNLRFDPATSASMSSISADVAGTDIFGITDIISTAISAAEYAPKSCERNPRDPYAGW